METLSKRVPPFVRSRSSLGSTRMDTCRESGEPWDVNLANAPFRLLAIVNRLDLDTGIIIDY